MSEREYIVTLHRREDLDSFYEDMETPGGDLYIPNRRVDLVARRPLSRNTHYRLTDQEADQLRQDPRVMSVELSMAEQGIEFKPLWSQTSSDWSKSSTNNSNHRNWGLLRSVEGAQRSNWGSNGTASQTGTISGITGGRHVDVVIVDGHMDPDHPEFAVNSDGTGGSRVNQINWFQYNPELGLPASNYVYTPYIDSGYPDNNGDGFSDRTMDNDHGTHVAGTACGNTQGWARYANIYNINPYASAPSQTSFFLDYIRIWHANKPINPVTGRKNPTISNHSYGLGYSIDISTITTVRYQGTVLTGPFTSAQLRGYGIYNANDFVTAPARSIAFEQDLIDLISDGTIVVGSAGNEYSKISLFSSTTSDDYNNYFVSGGFTYFYNRGTITAANGVICVGAVGSLVSESKADFSNCGPRVDLYAPGRFVMSSVNSTVLATVADSRNSSFRISKRSGTSMSSPQVTGALACLMESWPTMKQSQALAYLYAKSKSGQITDTAGGPTDYTDLQGSTNRYLFYFKERPETGQIYPVSTQGNRSTTGQTFPRTKIYRYGS
jgi:hypothetical protein